MFLCNEHMNIDLSVSLPLYFLRSDIISSAQTNELT